MLHNRFFRSSTRVFALLIAAGIALSPARIEAQDGSGTPPGTPQPPGSTVLAWPVPLPTPDQITGAKACALYCTMVDRYPETLSSSELAAAYTPVTACDWAALAAAYAARQGANAPLPEAAHQAFSEAVRANPALAFRIRLLAGYFDTGPLVEPPPFADQPITQVVIRYDFRTDDGAEGGPAGPGMLSVDWKNLDHFVDDTYCGPAGGGGGSGGGSGCGDGIIYAPVSYEMTITQANTPDAYATGVVRRPDGLFKYASPVSPELLQAFGPALRDLVPTGGPFAWHAWSGAITDWTVTLTFADGTEVTMFTQTSNMVFSGGPWQTVIDGQAYLQYSTAFLGALIDVVNALQLPVGRSPGGCASSPSEIINTVFPHP